MVRKGQFTAVSAVAPLEQVNDEELDQLAAQVDALRNAAHVAHNEAETGRNIVNELTDHISGVRTALDANAERLDEVRNRRLRSTTVAGAFIILFALALLLIKLF